MPMKPLTTFERKTAMRKGARLACLALTACALPAPAMAQAACPIELATYADRDKVAELNFRPIPDGSATTSNSFRMILPQNVVLDGFVQWTVGTPRAYATLHYNCPTGDVTGEEYDACTVWQGVVYTADDKGVIDLIPAQGAAAPKQLIFSDLGPALAIYDGFVDKPLAKAPWDVFEVSGCQE